MSEDTMETVVISLGGSVLVPQDIAVSYIERLARLVRSFENLRFIVICGGGKTARTYQQAARELNPGADHYALDQVGIRACQLNAELLRTVLGDIAHEEVICDPAQAPDTKRQVIVATAFKPGCSTDLRAVQHAQNWSAPLILNVSNVDHVYSADPRSDAGAEVYERMSWADYMQLIDEEWIPGKNAPFDPVAAREARKRGQAVAVIQKDIENIASCLRKEHYVGTLIR